jgi:hypothetical protein
MGCMPHRRSRRRAQVPCGRCGCERREGRVMAGGGARGAVFHAAGTTATAGTVERLRGRSRERRSRSPTLRRSGVCVCVLAAATRHCAAHWPRFSVAAASPPPPRGADRSVSPSYERAPSRDRVTATERAARRNVEGAGARSPRARRAARAAAWRAMRCRRCHATDVAPLHSV